MTESKTDEQLGEDPEVAKEIAEATKNLADFLSANQLEVDYYEADWRDTKGLIEGAHKLILEHPDWQLYYVGGDAFGIDANYVLLTSKPVKEDVVLKIGDYIVNLGAELPEEVIPPKPKCPKCGEEIEMLMGVYSASVSGWASILNGELNLQLEESFKLRDIIDEDSATWHCPRCDEQLFKAGEEDKMTVFLKGGE